MKALALLALAILMGACGADRSKASSPPSMPQSPTSTTTASAPRLESPSPPALLGIPSLRLVYRLWDGNQYSIVAANADGSNRVTLSGANFVHPDLIRFVQSRSRRWTAWADGGELRTAASDRLASAATLVTTSKLLSVLAISEDGDSIAYQTLIEKGPGFFSANLYVVHVHDRSVKLLRSFDGPMIGCLGDGVFDANAKRLIVVGCGAGKAGPLLVLNASDGSILLEDDGFFAWPNQWAFAPDLATVWLIDESSGESDVVRYDTATRNRTVLYRSPSWRQSDGSVAPNLSGFFISPDGSALTFSRNPPDRVREVYSLPSSGGTPTMVFKSAGFGRVESWSPDGSYIAVSVDNSTPTQRMRLIDPRTKAVVPVNTGAAFIEFLAWMVA
jgi:Tol biopolymer transport system component